MVIEQILTNQPEMYFKAINPNLTLNLHDTDILKDKLAF